jgi:hypothetical protein
MVRDGGVKTGLCFPTLLGVVNLIAGPFPVGLLTSPPGNRPSRRALPDRTRSLVQEH